MQAVTVCVPDATIQAGSISEIGLPNIPLLRNPAPNTTILLPGGYTVTLNKQTVAAGIRMVTAIYVTSFLQTLSVGKVRTVREGCPAGDGR